MPGKCKFQVAWLAKDIYKDWLVKDPHDIQLARCKACCKAIKLQTMGEAALTSHAAGTGHKAAVRKLVEGNIMVINVADHVNGYGSIKDEDDKEQVALSLHLNSFDRMTGSDPSAALDRCGGGGGPSSASHNASFQEVTFPTSFIDSCGVPSQSAVDCGVPRVPAHNHHHHHPRLLLQPPPQPPAHHHHPHHQQRHQSPSPARRRREEPGRVVAPPPAPPPPPTPRWSPAALTVPGRGQRQRVEVPEEVVEEELEEEERVEAPLGEQQAGCREQMESMEWERRMRVLAWEQEVLREKGRAARQKARAYRMKRRYYGAKLKRLGQEVPPSSCSSSSCSDEDEWGRGKRAPREKAAE